MTPDVLPPRSSKGLRLLGLVAALAAILPHPASATVSLGAWTMFSPDDISGFTTLSGDNNTASATIPFNFNIQGTNFTTVVISTNGWLEFGGNTQGTSDPVNACLPTSKHTNPFLAAYWDDNNTFGTAVRYGTVGTSPNRTFIVDYNVDIDPANEGGGADDLGFQVQLHESSNVINVRYHDSGNIANGQSATIGFQGAGGAGALAQGITCNGKVMDDNRPNEGWSVDVGRAGLMPTFALMAFSPDDITGFSTLTGDEATTGVVMPFSVTIEGTSYNTLTLDTNGYIQFGTGSGANVFTNTALPNASFPGPTLFYYWDDLQTEGGNIRYGTVGTSPNRTFIVDFQENLFNSTGDKVNGQVQIHEGSNLFNVKYRSTLSANANGQSATIGFQGAGGASAIAYPLTFNGKILDDNRPDEGWSVHSTTPRAMSLHAITAFSPDDISGFATLSGDDAIAGVTLPFTVTIDTVNYTTLTIGTNGTIQFGTTSGANPTANTGLPSASFTGPTLFYFWRDLVPEGGNIRYGTVGTSPHRTFIVDFQENLFNDSGSKVNGQAQIHEGSNVIEVKYRSTLSANANGQTATIGFQGAGGGSATPYPLTFNGKILDDNRPDSGFSVAPLPICGNSLIETGEQCDQGGANGSATSCCSSICTFKASGTTCRTSAGTCDVAETCTGASATCPADGFQASTVSCRGAAGECDLQENCPGNAAACPADAKKINGTGCTDEGNECTNDQCDGSNVLCQHPNKTNGTACTDDGNVCTTDTCQTGTCSHPAGNGGTTCRGTAGVCDVAETCTGASTVCPGDTFVASTVSCRASVSTCDATENCTGASAACPPDGFQASTVTCRGAVSTCDVAENCTGASTVCPGDTLATSSVTCRSAASTCDVAETCTGASTVCPGDTLAASTVACRNSVSTCDVTENCTGSSTNCPADGFQASTVTCRGAAGTCDLTENCTGSSTNCPADIFQPSTFTCRGAGGECDLDETCTGAGAACPSDAKVPNLTPCTDDGNVCSLDRCDGTNNACQHPAGNGGSTCRASAGICDIAETCTGASTVCPANAFEPTSTECRSSGGDCDPAEHCPGSGPSCPADARTPNLTPCSTDGNPCTVDQCDGTNVTCQHPAGNTGSICRTGSGDACDPDELCTGATSVCPPDITAGSATSCRPAVDECDIAENCGGSPSDPCPPDAKKASGSVCSSDGNPCSLDECDGVSDACQHPAGNGGATCRASAGVCDVAETCTGASTVCPADAFDASTVVCRGDAGECDLTENCTGSTAACPADAKKTSGTACTSDGNPCSLDQCNGTADTCQHPAGNSGTTCRAASGICDTTETCTGSSTVCPPNAFEPTSTECRSSNGECDPAEHCTGTGPTCPIDAKDPSGTACSSDGNPCSLDQCNGVADTCQHPAGNSGATCRASAGFCDVTETCTGSSTVCPADGFQASTVVCRGSAGECDLVENCTGTGATCPADVKEAATTACTDDGNPCSLDECDGTNDACQHPAGHAGALCRGSAGFCDVIESCTGASTVCPADVFQPATTVCRASTDACDVTETCTGTGATCPSDSVATSTVSCRGSAGFCDVQENCDGVAKACPADAFQPATVECRGSAGVCDVAENCTGASATCPTNTFAPSTQVCRASTDVCDAIETCTGAGASCPSDAVKPTSTVCSPSTDVCDPAENCNGLTKVCPTDVVLPDGTACSDASTCTANDTCISGVCTGDLSPDSCLDDFNCYKFRRSANTPNFVAVSGVSLVDQFEAATAKIYRPKLLCPPANKNAEGVVDEDTHLMSYRLRQTPRHVQHVGIKVTNQLGGLFIDTVRPDTLLVPTSKSLLGTPAPPNFGTIAVDYYKCYRIKVSKETPFFASNTTVSVTDQFDAVARQLSLRKPRHLCNPVDKDGQGIHNPDVHLLCYLSRPARGERKHVKRAGIYVNNQFGPLRLDTIREGEFCIPSVKTLP